MPKCKLIPVMALCSQHDPEILAEFWTKGSVKLLAKGFKGRSRQVKVRRIPLTCTWLHRWWVWWLVLCQEESCWHWSRTASALCSHSWYRFHCTCTGRPFLEQTLMWRRWRMPLKIDNEEMFDTLLLWVGDNYLKSFQIRNPIPIQYWALSVIPDVS